MFWGAQLKVEHETKSKDYQSNHDSLEAWSRRVHDRLGAGILK